MGSYIALLSQFFVNLSTVEKVSWVFVFFVASFCLLIVVYIVFVNARRGKKKRLSRRVRAVERLYNTGTVLAYSYASAWYRYAKRKESQAFETHGEMRDMRATATTQITSYLLGRDYISQKVIKDRSVKDRAVMTRAYVPLWADEIMGREPLFKELVLQSLAYGEYLEELEKKYKQNISDEVDLGSTDRRRQMIKKYTDGEEIIRDKKRYKELINIFSQWDDQYLQLSDAEKISRADKEELFLISLEKS